MTAEPIRLVAAVAAVDANGDSSAPVITLEGELDPATAPVLDDAIDQVLSGGATTLVIDMGGLSFVDSSGLRSLISAHKRLAPEPLRLRRPTPFARQLLGITGLDQQFEIEGVADQPDADA
jgi:anti-sigma B factor antagonist